MKKAKIAKTAKKQEIIENEYSIKQMVIITVSLVAIFGIFYFITSLIVHPTKELESIIDNKDDNYDFKFTEILFNHLLDREEKEYYVIAAKNSESIKINNDANYKVVYDKYIEDYSDKEDALTFYGIDLDDTLNKAYINEELNITNDLSKLKINDDVLFKIKEGKIEKYFVGNKAILEELNKLVNE